MQCFHLSNTIRYSKGLLKQCSHIQYLIFALVAGLSRWYAGSTGRQLRLVLCHKSQGWALAPAAKGSAT